MSKVLLELEMVRKSYTVSDTERVPVLRGVSLKVEPGACVAITGPSGSGKSTLLNLCGGLDSPDSGRVLFDGTDLGTLDDRALSGMRSRRIGFVFQLHHLLGQCTVLENVLVPTLAGGDLDRDARELAAARARTLLDQVGLSDRLDHLPSQISVGERQRAAIARALVNDPEVLLADEPTGALDSENSRQLAATFAELHEQTGLTMLVVTHSAEFAAEMATTLRLLDGVLSE